LQTRSLKQVRGLCELLKHISKDFDQITVKTSEIDPSITYKRSPPAAIIVTNNAYWCYKSGILRESQCP
jgi:hypothetical protein